MIRFTDVSFTYEDASAPALSHVDLEIPDGEMLAVVGHNGSGKSTLARCLNGLLVPAEGTVAVNGLKTSDPENLLSIRQHVGIVFQNPDNQLVTTIVEEDVAFGPENLGIPSEEIRVRVDEALKEVGMSGHARSASSTLSGGQKQRVAIAGMIAMRPDVLVLDEATAMLDPQGQSEVLGIVKKLHRETGITVVMITQHMEEIIPCDRVIVMDKGKVAMQGTPQEIFRHGDRLRKLGLDVPETVWLREKLEAGGIHLSGDPLTIEETAEAICRSFSKK